MRIIYWLHDTWQDFWTWFRALPRVMRLLGWVLLITLGLTAVSTLGNTYLNKRDDQWLANSNTYLKQLKDPQLRKLGYKLRDVEGTKETYVTIINQLAKIDVKSKRKTKIKYYTDYANSNLDTRDFDTPVEGFLTAMPVKPLGIYFIYDKYAKDADTMFKLIQTYQKQHNHYPIYVVYATNPESEVIGNVLYNNAKGLQPTDATVADPKAETDNNGHQHTSRSAAVPKIFTLNKKGILAWKTNNLTAELPKKG